MFWRLVFIFILVPAAELAVIWIVASSVAGILLLAMEIVATGMIGSLLLRRQSRICWEEWNRKLDHGEMPTLTLLNASLIFLAGALLISPGLLTDFLGILLLVPPIRFLVVSHITLRLEAYRLRSKQRPEPEKPDVIDV